MVSQWREKGSSRPLLCTMLTISDNNHKEEAEDNGVRSTFYHPTRFHFPGVAYTLFSFGDHRAMTLSYSICDRRSKKNER